MRLLLATLPPPAHALAQELYVLDANARIPTPYIKTDFLF